MNGIERLATAAAIAGVAAVVSTGAWATEPCGDIGMEDNATFTEEDGFCVNEVAGCGP